MKRLTFDPAFDNVPVWTPDSRAVIFSSQREGAANLFQVSADGVGPAKRLTESPNAQAPTGVTPDGRVVMGELMPSGARNLRLVTITDPTDANALRHGARRARWHGVSRWALPRVRVQQLGTVRDLRVSVS